jgi:hypothetical protein
MITPAATSPEITARGYKLIFRTIGWTAPRARPPATTSPTTSNRSERWNLHDKQQYGEGIATAVKQTLEKKAPRLPSSKPERRRQGLLLDHPEAQAEQRRLRLLRRLPPRAGPDPAPGPEKA